MSKVPTTSEMETLGIHINCYKMFYEIRATPFNSIIPYLYLRPLKEQIHGEPQGELHLSVCAGVKLWPKSPPASWASSFLKLTSLYKLQPAPTKVNRKNI